MAKRKTKGSYMLIDNVGTQALDGLFGEVAQ